jgi:site-specific recombinase XerD
MKSGKETFRSPMASEITDFLNHQRALGKKFLNEERALRLFDHYLIKSKVRSLSKITPTLVDSFLASRPRPRPRSYNLLLSTIRRLFKWLVRQGRLSQSPVQTPPRRATAAQVSFIFDRHQAKQLLELAAKLPDNNNGHNRGRIYFMAFALMYGLGLRVGEVARLRHRDIDWDRKLLVIRETKFLKSRLVPFGPKMEARLREYVQEIGKHGEADPIRPLFSFDPERGRAITTTTLTLTFHALWPKMGLRIPPGAAQPRLHCLRHSFAVGTLLRWYRSGINPQAHLWDLSTFMGHVHPASTAVYYGGQIN